MIKNNLILGMDIRQDRMNISSCPDNQKEVINENFILDKQWDGREICEKMEEFLLKYHPDKTVDSLYYACENPSISACKRMEEVIRKSGVITKDIRMISREKAFVQYVIHQKEELYRHTVLAFEFDEESLSCYRLYHPNKKQLKEMRIEKELLLSLAEEERKNMESSKKDEIFAEIAKQVLAKEVVSTVFLTGKGFEGEWLKKSLKVLCDGRKAFFGQNLFSAGCCYYGTGLCTGEKSDYVIQTPETVFYNAGVIDSGLEDRFVKITESGSPWFETKGSIDVFLERGKKVDVVFVHAQTQEKQVESVDISGLLIRAGKMGRLEISLEFLGKNEGVIVVKDKGFGQFSPSTHQVFLKEFQLL